MPDEYDQEDDVSSLGDTSSLSSMHAEREGRHSHEEIIRKVSKAKGAQVDDSDMISESSSQSSVAIGENFDQKYLMRESGNSQMH